MRFLLVALLAAGCLQDPTTDPGWNDPPIGEPGPGPTGPGCQADADCGTNAVCARDGECVAPSDVRVAHISWTVNGVAADATSCTTTPDLELDFFSGEQAYGYEPVPCKEGKFSIDKLPIWYTSVQLTSQETGATASGTIDAATGDVSLDLTQSQ
jgi:hypothetical protein